MTEASQPAKQLTPSHWWSDFSLRWGSTLATQLSSAVVHAIINDKARSMGYKVRTISNESNTISTEFYLPDPLWKTLRRRLPGALEWRIWRDQNITFIYCDSKLSPSYAIALLLSCLTCAALFCASWTTFTGTDWLSIPTAQLRVLFICFLVSIVLLFVNYGLLIGGSIERLQPILSALRQKALTEGSYLARDGPSISLRHLFRCLAYLFLVAVLVIFAFAQIGSPTNATVASAGALAMLAPFVALALILSFNIPLFLRFPGSSERVLPALSGMTGAIAILVFCSVPMLWIHAGPQLTQDEVEALHVCGSFIQGNWTGQPPTFPDGTPATLETVKRMYGTIRLVAWAYIVGSVFLPALGLCFVLSAFATTLKAWPYLHQMSQRPDIAWSQQTILPAKFILPFRVVWGTSWFLVACCLMCLFTNLMIFTFDFTQSVFSSEPRFILNSVDLSSPLVSVACNLAIDNPLIRFIVCSTWGFYLIICWGMLFVPLGGFIVQEQISKRNLRIPALHASKTAHHFVRSLDGLKSDRTIPAAPIELVVIQSRFPFARALSLGLLREKRVIEISSGCFHALTDDEVNAMLAHEVAHLSLGHCRKDRMLRFLGRITFVGDGFVRMLQDSAGYEIEADRCAVEHLQVGRNALITCLQKVQIVTALENLEQFSETTGLSIHSKPTSSEVDLTALFSDLPRLTQLKLGVELYVQQYLGLKYSGYWHPSILHRIAILKELKQQHVQTVREKEPEIGWPSR